MSDLETINNLLNNKQYRYLYIKMFNNESQYTSFWYFADYINSKTFTSNENYYLTIGIKKVIKDEPIWDFVSSPLIYLLDFLNKKTDKTQIQKQDVKPPQITSTNNPITDKAIEIQDKITEIKNMIKLSSMNFLDKIIKTSLIVSGIILIGYFIIRKVK